MEPRPEFIDADDVADRLGIAVHSFRKLVATGILPLAHSIGPKTLYWSEEDVNGMAWVLKNLARFRKQTPEEEERDAK